jgi:hypothetical protein
MSSGFRFLRIEVKFTPFRVTYQDTAMHRPGSLPFRRTVLAACLGALTSPVFAVPTSWTVDTCTDKSSSSGTGTTGSLRYTIAKAVSGDTIDLTKLPVGCSKITLTGGFIAIGQDDLTITGPGADALTISGANNTVIFDDYAPSGELRINYLTLADGYYSGPVNAQGGCLYSHVDILLNQSVVTNCSVQGTLSVVSKGGGVYSHGNLTLAHSTVSGNSVTATGSAGARGGGVYAGGALYLNESVIDGNSVSASAGGSGGGAFSHGYTQLAFSTISNNSATSGGGGITGQGKVTVSSSTISGNQSKNGAGLNATGGLSRATLISNSTISGNTASGNDGGIYANTALTLENSTIAFNTANLHGGIYAAGPTLDLESSILANNTAAGSPSDLDAAPAATITGANNLIMHSTVTPPAGTLSGCPLLGPLRDNGGTTLTHALSSGSPAIDAGNNIAVERFDQRASGYVRTSGSSTDIGAYEVQQTEIIFSSGFEGCD